MKMKMKERERKSIAQNWEAPRIALHFVCPGSSWFMAGSLQHSHRHWRRHYLGYLYKCFQRGFFLQLCHMWLSLDPCKNPVIGIYKSINEIYTHILCYVFENLLDFSLVRSLSMSMWMGKRNVSIWILLGECHIW